MEDEKIRVQLSELGTQYEFELADRGVTTGNLPADKAAAVRAAHAEYNSRHASGAAVADAVVTAVFGPIPFTLTVIQLPAKKRGRIY